MSSDQNAFDVDDDLFDDEDTQKDKYLTFHIASEDYGIAIANVTEIIGIQSITEIPEMPDQAIEVEKHRLESLTFQRRATFGSSSLTIQRRLLSVAAVSGRSSRSIQCR